MQVYDEFSMFADNAAEAGLEWRGQPRVERRTIAVSGGRNLSALVWQPDKPADLVLLHGGAQNAHTWDTVALALDRPLVAIDLPGHGHSDWRDDGDYGPQNMADNVATAIRALVPSPTPVIGMSLGGMTALCLTTRHPSLVTKLGLVDVTPGVDHAKAEPIIAFVTGPEFFDDFASILARTIEHNPTRTESSLRRGILHNAREVDDGRWSWRYDPMRSWKRAPEGETPSAEKTPPAPDFKPLWDELATIRVPITLWRGAKSGVVDDADVARVLEIQPTATVIVVDGAGHSIQGDRPVELARSIEAMIAK
ncbi:MAG: alpha/beta hydrolase [Acidimicrobiales bacterium]